MYCFINLELLKNSVNFLFCRFWTDWEYNVIPGVCMYSCETTLFECIPCWSCYQWHWISSSALCDVAELHSSVSCTSQHLVSDGRLCHLCLQFPKCLVCRGIHSGEIHCSKSLYLCHQCQQKCSFIKVRIYQNWEIWKKRK